MNSICLCSSDISCPIERNLLPKIIPAFGTRYDQSANSPNLETIRFFASFSAFSGHKAIGFVCIRTRLRDHAGMSNRTVSITSKMTNADFELLQKAAKTLWPKAMVSQSSLILGLAKLGAEQALKSKKRNKARMAE
jgi:hypothetical protein